MKRYILTILLVTCQLMTYADGSALLIEMRDGTTASYILSEKPIVTFGDNSMLVKCSDASTEYDRANIARFTFVDASQLGIAPLSEGSIIFEYHDDVICMAGAPIQVFSTNGTIIKQGLGEVSLTDQPSGVYVVKANSQVIKVLKK